MQNASRRGRIGFRRGGAFSPSIRNPELATPTGFHGLTVRGGRRKIEKIPAESLVSYFLFSFFFFLGEREKKEESCKTQRDSWARSYLPIGNFRKSGKIFQKDGNSLCHNADPISYKRWKISEVLCTLDCLLFSFLARFDNCNKSNYTSFIFYFFFLRQRTETRNKLVLIFNNGRETRDVVELNVVARLNERY